MRSLFAFSLISVVMTGAVLAAPAPQESWGKAGITLDQYRRDALDCGLQGYYTDISKTDDAKEFVRASRRLDAMTTGSNSPNTTGAGGSGPVSTDTVQQLATYAADQQHVVDSLRPQERFRNIKKTLESSTEHCLMQRGYSKFRLTDDQRRQLRHLKFGSDERRAYLYGLATNPAVLESQRATAQP
jgi:hypothetical protein